MRTDFRLSFVARMCATDFAGAFRDTYLVQAWYWVSLAIFIVTRSVSEGLSHGLADASGYDCGSSRMSVFKGTDSAKIGFLLFWKRLG
jgi:hypothetical protein